MQNRIPVLPESRPIDKSDKPFFKELFSRIQPDISEYTFTNLYVWRKKTGLRISQFKDGVIFITHEGIMAPVVSRPTITFFKELFEILRRKGIAEKGVRFPEAMANIARTSFPVEDDRGDWDYVYRTEKLIHLRGRHLDGKRNLIKNFKRAHSGYQYLPIDVDRVKDCLELQEEWCNLKQCYLNEGLASENRAIYELFEDYAFFEVSGAAIAVEGRIVAFAVGEKLNDTTAVIHFEKADQTLTGIYQVLNNEFIQNAFPEFQCINMEQDLGDEGMRKAKLSYVPDRFVKKYTVYF